MSTLEAIILAIVQGIAEFFPLSSSGHLMLGEQFFGLGSGSLLFSLVLNLGTMLAIVVVLWPQIKALDKKRLMQIIVALIPLFPIVFFLKPIKAVMGNVQFLGLWFVVTACVLFVGEKVGGRRTKAAGAWWEPLLIGIFQAFAVLPGLSRLGLTVSTARCLGWSRYESTLFSFLLAVPVAIGAIGVEVLSIVSEGQVDFSLPWQQYIIGFFIAFAVGTIALKGCLRYVKKHTFLGFALYCLIVGIVTQVYVNL